MDPEKVYNVPCQCQRCNNIYLSGNKIIGKLLMGEYRDAGRKERLDSIRYFGHLEGFGGTYPCPVCGKGNEFHVDIIDLIEDSYNAFTKVSLTDLINLENKLKSALDDDISAEKIQKLKLEIVNTAPELSGISGYLPKTRAEFYAFCSLLLVIIGFCYDVISSGEPIPPIKIEQTIIVKQEKFPTLKELYYTPRFQLR